MAATNTSRLKTQLVPTALSVIVAALAVFLVAQIAHGQSAGDIFDGATTFNCDTQEEVHDSTGIAFPTPKCDGDDSSSSSSSGSSSSSSSSSSSGGSSSSSTSSSSGGSSSSSGSTSSGGSSSSSSGSSSSSSSGGSSSGSSGGGSSPSSSGGSSSSGSSSSGGGNSGSGNTYRARSVQTTPLATATGECVAYLTDFIRFGEANNANEVTKLQQFLRDEEGFEIPVTGVYDEATRSAVLAFQARYSRDILSPWGAADPTGYVYLTTRKKVNELHCENAQQFNLSEEELALIEEVRVQGVGTNGAVDESVGGGGVRIIGVDAADTSESSESMEEEGDRDTDVLVEDSVGSAQSASVAESSLGKFFRGVGSFVSGVFSAIF